MISLVGWCLLLWIGGVTLVLLAELWLGLLPQHAAAVPTGSAGVAIIVPAFDEATIIGNHVTALLALEPAVRVLVVADNCSDDTAVIARAAGAEVIERRDPAHRGKGFALAFARDHLAAEPPDVVIVIDADCSVDAASLARLAFTASRHGRPVQAAYLMRPRRDRGALVALSGFAFLVKNWVRQRGLARLGAPAILTGSGMAFPWALFVSAPLASGDTVEDLVLGVALARRGTPPVFLQDAIVWTEAANQQATHGQRSRWEQGFLATAIAQAPALIGSARPGLLWLGLHLLVPPLAMLVLWHLGVLAWLLLLPSPPVARATELALLAALLAGLGIAWLRQGRDWLSGAMLAAIPFYILWKLPIYAAAALGRKRAWNRTGRD